MRGVRGLSHGGLPTRSRLPESGLLLLLPLLPLL